MKLTQLLLFFVCLFLMPDKASSQSNATLNILALNSGQVAVGQTVDIQVTVGNTGPTAAIGTNKVRAQISLPPIVTALTNVQQTGLPSGWSITTNLGNSITVCNGTDAIPVGVQRQILIKVQGVSVGGPSTINGSLLFSNGVSCAVPGTLAGDNTADNTGTTSIRVIASVPCTLGVSASAGIINCNGGTTTLTATSTGANGSVEYSLNGGTYQSSNIFSVNAAGSPFTITAREVTNNTCTATSSQVTVTEPAAVPPPSVHVVQPTCAVATGTVTITSSTTTLTFSVDGGAYAPYQSGGYVLATGFHTLTAQNSNGCISTVTNITIDAQPATPAAPTINIVQPTCTVANGTVTIISSTSGLTFSVDGGAYAAYPLGGYVLTTGSHTLTAQNSSGCISLVTSISINAPLGTPTTPTISIIQPICTIATGTVTITSSTSGLTFSLNGGAYAAYPSGGYVLATGSHTLAAQNSSGCISPVANITIDAQPPTPAAPIINIVQPTCTVATGTVTITSSISGLTFSIDGGAFATYPPGGYLLATGSHTITAQNSSGCISAITNITVNAQPLTPSAPLVNTITQPTCLVSTGSVELGGLPSGNWIINPGSIAGNASSIAITGLSQGTYNFTVTNTSGCISSSTANVIINDVPGAPGAPAVNVVHPTCAIANGTLVVTSAIIDLTFSLDGGPFAIYPTGGYVVSAGTHSLVAQNSANCISPITNITVNAQPVTPAAPTFTVVHPTCTVTTGTITVTSSTTGLLFSLDGGAYASYPSGGYIVNAGTHSLQAQNISSCISVASNIIVNAQPPVPFAPVIGTVSQPTCLILSGSIELTGLPSGNWTLIQNPGSVSIQGNTSSAIVSNLIPGTYNFTVTNSSGCISSLSANAVISIAPGTPAAPTVSIVHPTCTLATGTITVTSSTTGLLFSLDGGVYASYPSGGYIVSPGTHTLRAQASGDCISDPINIIINSQPPTPAEPTFNVVHPTCTVATGMLTITSSTSGLTFSLDGSAYAAYPSGGYTVSPGTHTFTAQNTSGCISSVVNITVNTQPATPSAPVVTITQPTCTNAMGVITITSSITDLLFSLDGGAYASYPPGGYIVSSGIRTLTAQNISGCISSATNITVDAQPSTPSTPIVSVVQPTCSIATAIILVNSSVSGLTFSLDGGSYASYPTGGFIVTPGQHTITAQNSSACISNIVTVIVNPQPVTPTASIAAGTIICNGGTTTLTVTASGGSTPFEYSINGGAFQSSNIFTVGAGAYTVIARNADLCSVTLPAVNLMQPAAITASLAAGTIGCNGATTTVIVTASGGTSSLQYSLNGSAFQSSNTFTVTAGTYTATVRDANGCIKQTNTITNSQPPILTASATAPRIIECGGMTIVSVNASGGRAPYTATGNFTRDPGTWEFVVTDANGCTARTEIIIEAPGCIELKVFPNPAGESISIYHSAAASGSTIELFNILGQKLLSKPVSENSFLSAIDLNRFAAGAYVVVFFNGREKKSVLIEKAK